MALFETLEADLKKALKEGKSLEVETLRLLLAAIHNQVIEKRSKTGEDILSDEEILEVLRREVKRRKEAAQLYLQGNRKDLAEKENKELKIIERYLPPPLTLEEVEQIVKNVIKQTKAKSQADFGKVMGMVMKEIKGQAEAKMVTEIVKKNLNAS